jgi:hypothetical protein
MVPSRDDDGPLPAPAGSRKREEELQRQENHWMRLGGGASKTHKWEKDPLGDFTEEQLKEWNKDARQKQLRDRISALEEETTALLELEKQPARAGDAEATVEPEPAPATSSRLQHERRCGDFPSTRQLEPL